MEKIKNVVNEHKMLVVISTLVVAIAIISVILLITRPEDKLPAGGSNVTVDNTTEDDNVSGISTEPDNSESLENFSDGSSESDTKVDNPVNDGSEESTTTHETDNSQSTSNTESSSSAKEPDNSESNTPPVTSSSESKEPEQTTSSETIPTEESTSVTPESEESVKNVPSVSWTGTPISLPTIGVTIPTLKDFNDEALFDNTNDTFWTGSSDSVEPAQQLYDTLNAVRRAVVDAGALDSKTGQGFAVEQYSISWDWSSYSAVNHDFQLYRNPLDATYTLTINCPLDSYKTSWGRDVTMYNREIVLTLCSIFSSTPQTVYDYIYKGLYEDASVLDGSRYQTIGDCKVKFDTTNSTSKHFVFYFKAN